MPAYGNWLFYSHSTVEWKWNGSRMRPLQNVVQVLIGINLHRIKESAIDQLHTRAKEFNWRDVTSGCSFAAT